MYKAALVRAFASQARPKCARNCLWRGFAEERSRSFNNTRSRQHGGIL